MTNGHFFTAYGNAINFTMSGAATQYLYSGEQFDSRVGQQYLRARYYDQSTGSFNRLDPFFGNQTDPQSFHKYLYTHGDPINGIDPTGLFNVPSMIASIRIQANAFAYRVTTFAAVSAGVVGRFGNQLGARAQQFAGMVMNGVRGLQIVARDNPVSAAFRNQIDYMAQLVNNRVVMVEVKFALPRSGAAVTRLANQMRAMYDRVQTEGVTVKCCVQ